MRQRYRRFRYCWACDHKIKKKSYSSRIMTIKNFHFRALMLWIEFIKNKWFRSIKTRKLTTSKSVLYNVCRVNKIKFIFVCENDCTINFLISLYKYCIWQHFFIKDLQIFIAIVHLNLSIVSSFHFARISITTKIFEINVVNFLQNQNWFICISQDDDVDFSMSILRVFVHVNKRIILFNFRFQKIFNVLIDFRAINVILNIIVLIRMQWTHDQKHDIILRIQLFHHFHFIVAWRHVSNDFIALINRCEIVECFVKFAISILDDDEFFDELFDLIAHSKIIDIKKIDVSFRFDSNDKSKNFQRKQLKSKNDNMWKNRNQRRRVREKCNDFVFRNAKLTVEFVDEIVQLTIEIRRRRIFRCRDDDVLLRWNIHGDDRKKERDERFAVKNSTSKILYKWRRRDQVKSENDEMMKKRDEMFDSVVVY